MFSTQANEENSKKRLVELQESVDAAKKEKSQLILESEEAKAKLRNEMDLLKQRMEQLVDEGADRQEKIDRLEAKRNELIAQVWGSYQRVIICIFLRFQAVLRINEILVRIGETDLRIHTY